jgi:hypothetical protein
MSHCEAPGHIIFLWNKFSGLWLKCLPLQTCDSYNSWPLSALNAPSIKYFSYILLSSTPILNTSYFWIPSLHIIIIVIVCVSPPLKCGVKTKIIIINGHPAPSRVTIQYFMCLPSKNCDNIGWWQGARILARIGQVRAWAIDLSVKLKLK